MNRLVWSAGRRTVEWIDVPDGFHDAQHSYDRTWKLTESRVPSAHFALVLSIDGRAVCSALVGIDEWLAPSTRSCLVFDERLIVACGNQVLAFSFERLELLWQCTPDIAPVFALVRIDAMSFLVKGELEISRWTTNGERVWSVSCPDVFDGELTLVDGRASITDFLGGLTTIDVATGASQCVGPSW